MKHVILVGACYLDTILDVPTFPEEDSKLRASHLGIRRGGNCPNSLEVLQQLVADDGDVTLHLVVCLPRQGAPATQRILSSFGDDSKISFRHCIYRQDHKEAASSYIIRSQESGSRTIVNYNELPEMTYDEFADIVESFSRYDQTWWHFEGRIPSTTLACLRLLRAKLPKANISVEVEKPDREGLCQLAAEADVVFYSRTWAESRGHKSAEACLVNEHRHEGSLGLCTWGADGATVMSQATGVCLHCPVGDEMMRLSVIVDPIGAGDTFIAGVLYGLVRNGWPLLELGQVASFAVKLATLKIQREGFEGLGRDIAKA